jgi:hypothetical protein
VNTVSGTSPVSGTMTSGSPVITGLTSTTNIRVGQRAFDTLGNLIPSNAKVQSVDSGTQVTLTQNCTGTATNTIAFYFNKSLTGFRYDFQANTHEWNQDETHRLLVTATMNRSIFGLTGVNDPSTIQYNWITLGGVMQILDIGTTALPDMSEVMLDLTGGATRTFGTKGSLNQTGIKLTGFGAQNGLIAGTDSCYAVYANGGWFAHQYNYLYTGTAGPNNGLFFGSTTSAGLGYDGTNFVIQPTHSRFRSLPS